MSSDINPDTPMKLKAVCNVCGRPAFAITTSRRFVCQIHAKRTHSVKEAQAPTAARNSPCPCGSGTKFKKCCFGKQQPEPPKPKTMNSMKSVSTSARIGEMTDPQTKEHDGKDPAQS
jgi:hypothetical protein